MQQSYLESLGGTELQLKVQILIVMRSLLGIANI